MSIGLTFTGKIDSPRALLEAARVLAVERKYHLTAGEKIGRASCRERVLTSV